MWLNPATWFKSTPEPVKERAEPRLIKSDVNEFGIRLLSGSHTFAGVNVTTDNATKLETVYACIRDKSESIGQLPVILKTKDGKRITSGRDFNIFCKKPNSFMTMQDLIEIGITCLETYGNFYAYLVRNKYGNVTEIIPFRYQTNVVVDMDMKGNVYYTYTTNDGQPLMGVNGSEILHIKLNSYNGVKGMSPISVNTMMLGIALSQENHTGSLMENDAVPRMVLETDHFFEDEQKGQRILKDWNDIHGGSGNSGKTALLEHGLKAKAMTISPKDAELLEQRKLSRTQICAIFRVPPHRVGIEGKFYDTLEENNIAYLRDSLMPLIVKLENALTELTRGEMTIKIDTKGFARGDRKSQVEAVTSEFKMGAIDINEMRVDLDREPKEGGDVHAIDTNNLTFGKLTDIQALQAEARANAQAAANNNPAQSEGDEDAE